MEGIEFENECFEILSEDQALNSWFIPIDPLTSISAKEVCKLHLELFESLGSQGITSLAEHINFSYLIIMDLFLDASEMEDYEDCNNKNFLKGPKKYCQDHLKNNPVF